MDHAQNLPGLAPHIWLTLFQISSKSVQFRRSYCWMREDHFCPIEYFQYRLFEPIITIVTNGQRILTKTTLHIVPLLNIEWTLSLLAVIDDGVHTAQHRLPKLFNRPDNPPKLPYPVGWSRPHLIHDSLGPPKFTLQSVSRSVQPFLWDSWTSDTTETTLLCL